MNIITSDLHHPLLTGNIHKYWWMKVNAIISAIANIYFKHIFMSDIILQDCCLASASNKGKSNDWLLLGRFFCYHATKIHQWCHEGLHHKIGGATLKMLLFVEMVLILENILVNIYYLLKDVIVIKIYFCISFLFNNICQFN